MQPMRKIVCRVYRGFLWMDLLECGHEKILRQQPSPANQDDPRRPEARRCMVCHECGQPLPRKEKRNG